MIEETIERPSKPLSVEAPRAPQAPRGVAVKRHFTTPGVHPADELVWDRRTAAITGEDGKVVFEQRDIEVPKTWSMLATNVVASKYFRGAPGTPEREGSVRALIARVVDTIVSWGKVGGYFATAEDAVVFEAELSHLLLRQKAAFNSPVWFNLGVKGTNERPQTSACFINSVEDTMESILGLAKTEGMLFKYGSGTGTNLSTLRGSKELLAGGGTASGPVSFMRGFDAFAGVIKSGGKTRRAAKMVILNDSHPDIRQFVTCKADEEKKAWALIDAGYDPSFNGEAYSSVFFQNSNNSVRASDAFMRAVESDSDWQTRAVKGGQVMETFKARALYREICDAAHLCGDPGMQFHDTIQKWHTCKTTGPINASNPCVTGETLVATSDGLRRIDSLLEKPFRVVGADGELHNVEAAFKTGIKPIYRLTTKSGLELKLTGDHKVFTRNHGDVPACELTKDDVLVLGRQPFGQGQLDARLGEFLGLLVGDGCLSTDDQVILTLAPEELAVAERTHAQIDAVKKERAIDGRAARDTTINQPQGTLRLSCGSRVVVEEMKQYAVLDKGSAKKAFRPEIFGLDQQSVAAVLRGLFTADGTVANYGEKSQYISLDSTSLSLLQQTQLLLLSFGIKSKLYRDRRVAGQTMALLPDGKGGRKEYPVDQIHSLRISRSSRLVFEKQIGFVPGSIKCEQLSELNRTVSAYEDRLEDRVAALSFVGEEAVYDLTEPSTHHFVANGLVVHNCSEYVFLDDTACNLSSINLMQFRTADGEFDVPAFSHAVDVLILAQEILVDSSSYPTEKITKNSHAFRPLGLGFANLGALLMARGLAYDSDEGRQYAGAITALMTGEAYAQSARIAGAIGPFAGFAVNRDSMLNVIGMHRKAAYGLNGDLIGRTLLQAAELAWDDALSLGNDLGYRNAQVTVLAPTGTISFMMDCDTTGIEPDIALIKYKKLVGGGVLKIVNGTVPSALKKLGYSDSEQQAILGFLERDETIEGAPGLKPEHLSVFDCAFKPAKGHRSIQWMGHVKMMAACQPFLSGAISKTVNLPRDAKVEDIERAYTESWKLGLKAVAVYRDGCKRTQPLNTSKDAKDSHKDNLVPATHTVRRKLPDERRALTHKFNIAGNEGYLTVGMYDDGTPGELFIVMAKEGSTISGLMDSFATSISLALQYGVPLHVLVEKFSHVRYEPSGFTGNKDIPIAKSLTDYIFRYLALKFLNRAPEPSYESPAAPEPKPVESPAQLKLAIPNRAATFLNQSDAPPCSSCGSIMVRSGACYRCSNCGTTSGCS